MGRSIVASAIAEEVEIAAIVDAVTAVTATTPVGIVYRATFVVPLKRLATLLVIKAKRDMCTRNPPPPLCRLSTEHSFRSTAGCASAAKAHPFAVPKGRQQIKHIIAKMFEKSFIGTIKYLFNYGYKEKAKNR